MKTYSSLHIERTILLGFLSVITTGALFIWGFGYAYGRPLSFLDAFFTATSATCVTGLIVTDTALLPFPSQVTILTLIQIGGIGIMTVTTGLLMFMRKRIGVHEALYLSSGLNIDSPFGARQILTRVGVIVFCFELCGAIALFFGFHRHFTANEAVWHAVFHSVSAFCNAGFSTFSDSLTHYSRSILVPGTIMLLIVAGGLGFLVIHEIWNAMVYRRRLSPHTALVIDMTAFLIIIGAVLFLLSDHNDSLSSFSSWAWKAWNALFISVTSRTAGFNTIDMAPLSGFGVFLIVCLMMIGASPGSTGGGIKTTTFGLLWLSTICNIKGEEQVVFRNRSIAISNVLMAFTVATIYITTMVIGAFLLRMLEPHSYKQLLFESASAMGTVGLSLDLTFHLGSASKFVLILLMFGGRVGILTFVYGFTGRKRIPGNITYPETGIPIG